jgi:hypothetical protein
LRRYSITVRHNLFHGYATYVCMGVLHMYAWVCYICLHGCATYVCMGMLHVFAWVCYICLHGYATYVCMGMYICLQGYATYVCMGVLHLFAWVCYICLHGCATYVCISHDGSPRRTHCTELLGSVCGIGTLFWYPAINPPPPNVANKKYNCINGISTARY